jgi:hypothetical protein
LAELGERFAAVEVELQALATSGSAKGSPAPGSPAKAAQPGETGLEADWAAFETQQELEALRRKLQR